MLGASVAGYRIEAVAGRGGMGIVYRARQLALDRPVALKLIAPELALDESFRARFVRESRLTASLDHPNVIPVYEAGEDGERLFIAMRFVDGTDLGRLLAERGALDPALAASLVAQAASALDAAHARGLVHRDVKPANLLIAGGWPHSHVYLTDFGLARRDGSTTALTTTGNWMGTPDYAAPEQIDGGELAPAADVYALGCVLFAALTGQPPFSDRARMAKAAAHLHEPPPALRDVRPGVVAAFEPVVARALAKDPAERYASAGELGAAALAAASGATARTRRLGRRPQTAAAGAAGAAASPAPVPTARLAGRGRPPCPRRAHAIVAALVLAALGVGIAVTLGAFSPEKTPSTAKARPVRTTPPPPPMPNASAGTVRCSDTACMQGDARVQPPIEGSPCSAQARAGRWTRIDAASQTPLFACVPSSEPPSDAPLPAAVPDLEGARLDLAEGLLDRLGVEHDTSGGGTFGIIERDAWTVCATRPAPGDAPADGDPVKLFVDRSC
jgi:serine/threonine-protein kinase